MSESELRAKLAKVTADLLKSYNDMAKVKAKRDEHERELAVSQALVVKLRSVYLDRMKCVVGGTEASDEDTLAALEAALSLSPADDGALRDFGLKVGRLVEFKGMTGQHATDAVLGGTHDGV